MISLVGAKTIPVVRRHITMENKVIPGRGR
jgi:hypothetical protein